MNMDLQTLFATKENTPFWGCSSTADYPGKWYVDFSMTTGHDSDRSRVLFHFRADSRSAAQAKATKEANKRGWKVYKARLEPESEATGWWKDLSVQVDDLDIIHRDFNTEIAGWTDTKGRAIKRMGVSGLMIKVFMFTLAMTFVGGFTYFAYWASSGNGWWTVGACIWSIWACLDPSSAFGFLGGMADSMSDD